MSSAHLHLLGTPSSGVDEVVKALQAAHAYGGRTATVARLKRRFGPRTASADISTALASAVSAGFVTDDSGDFSLTASGHTHARHAAANRYAYVT